MTTENIVFVEYNGVDRPSKVWTNKREMFYFSMKDGHLYAKLAGMSKPYMHKLRTGIKPRKVWFKEDYRPVNGSLLGEHLLQNREIVEFGYSIMNKPTFIEEIVDAIHS